METSVGGLVLSAVPLLCVIDPSCVTSDDDDSRFTEENVLLLCRRLPLWKTKRDLLR